MMRNYKKSKYFNSGGFTLTELLIVIAVLGILTCIGLVIYTNVQRSARDSRRKADVKAITTAMEIQYGTSGNYMVPLTGENFANGAVPVPVEGGSYITAYGEGNKGFQVCAALENHPVGTSCDVSVPTCHCVRSIQEEYIAVVPTPTLTPTPTSTPTTIPTTTPTPGPVVDVTKFVGSAANTTGYGSIPWTNPGNIFVEDGVNAVAGIGSHGIIYTNYLDATNLTFNIPAGATIDGIKVEIRKQTGISTSIINDDQVKILKNGVMGAANKAEAANWPTAYAYSVYGGPSDLWGETWVPADINSPTFGVRLSAKATLAFAWVDAIRITVYYTN